MPESLLATKYSRFQSLFIFDNKITNMQPSNQKHKKTKGKPSNNLEFKTPILLAGIIIISFLAFSPSLKNGFTNWDDPALIIDNLLIKDFSIHNIKRIFTEVYFANYQPLHIFSYMLEYKAFGLNPTGYHSVSLLMHLLNVLLVYLLILKLSSGNKTVALITALLWSLSPMRTESVCWAAERKDLLYSIFFFASLITYITYLTKNSNFSIDATRPTSGNKIQIKYLILTFVFFILSVFSKTMAVSIVPVLFLLDYYYGRNFSFKSVLEKAPFILLSVVMGMISVYASKDEGSISSNMIFTFSDRVFFASHNLINYIVKSIIPYNQSAFYDYIVKSGNYLPVKYYLSAFIVLAGIVFVFITARKNKLLLLVSGYFFCTVFLILMLIPVGPTVFSERYTYVPSVLLFFIIVSYCYDYFNKIKMLKIPVILVLTIYSIALFVKTQDRSKVWNNSISLWTDASKKFPSSPYIYNNLGDAYFNAGNNDASIYNFSKAIQYDSLYAQAWANRGNAFGQAGKPKESLNDLNKAILLNPTEPKFFNKRGQANAINGNIKEAIADFNQTIKLNPDFSEAYFNIGITYLNQHLQDSACIYLKKAVAMGFDKAIIPNNDICR